MIGKVLGHYRIEAQLGAGGMGVVYRAHDEHLQRAVAIKMLVASQDDTARTRVLLEGRAASALNHPYICTVHAVDTWGEVPYIVMELVEGRPLPELIGPEGLALSALLEYGCQIAEALAHAHAHGIVHRDLKSANVIITTDNRAKVLDFGLARRLSSNSPAATAPLTHSEDARTLSGTLAYMAPEVLRGDPADARSDIWALGVVLYELAAGRLPFGAASGFELTAAILRDPMAPLPAHLPPAFKAIVLRCLARVPAQRYQRASDVRAALEVCLAAIDETAPPAVAAKAICPSCHREASPEAAFCPSCGSRLHAVCDRCGARNTAAHRFCSQCGHELVRAPAPVPQAETPPAEVSVPSHLADRIIRERTALEGERKQVTVLFCQLADAERVAERSGPEAMRAMLHQFVALGQEEVHRYEGTVNQFLDDGFMAIFGAPVVHEDDARRAVLAALGIDRRVRAWRTTAQGNGAHPSSVRMGINTGPVIVGRITDTLQMEYTAIGETTRLAALLQQVAEADAVLLSEATHLLVREHVRAEPLELHVRTRSGPVVAYVLIGLRATGSLFDARSRRLAEFVGRGRELATLTDLVEQVRASRGQAIGLVGEPGIGKSRLLYEFRQAALGPGAVFLEGRCVSYGTAIPYLPLLDILRAQCNIGEGDTPDEIAGKVTDALRGLELPADENRPYVLHALGLSELAPALAPLSPQAIKIGTFNVLHQMLIRSSRRAPLVLVVEDLHWIDSTSEEFLASLVEQIAAAPIMLVTTCRPGYRPPWIDRSYATQITLRALASHDSLRVVSSMGAEVLSSELSRTILHKAEGNPFFLEELARAIVERGAADQHIPATVQGVIMARIDRLPEKTKRVLQTASVLGREIPLALLGHVLEETGSVEPELQELRRLEFLHARAGDDSTYVFKHALTQDVAYEGLLAARREVLHERAARAFEELYDGRLEEVEGALAYHYGRTRETGKAVTYLVRVADRAARIYANAEAIAHLREALAHLERLPDGPERDRLALDVVLRQAHSLYFLGRFRESVDLLLPQAARLERLGDARLAGEYYFWLAHMYSRLGDQPRAAASAGRAITDATRAGDAATIGKANGLLALEGHWSGRPAEGIAHGEEAVRILDHTAQRWWLGMAHFYLAMNYVHSGRFDTALAAAEQARCVGLGIGDPRLQSYAAFMTGWALASRGECEAAIAVCRQALDHSPDPVSRVYATLFLGFAYLEAADPARALPQLEPASEALERFAFPQWQGLALALQADAHRLAGARSRADVLARAALETTTGAQYRYGAGFARRALGRIAADDGRLEAAWRELEDALQVFTSIHAVFEAGRTRLDLAAVARARADSSGAREQLDLARRAFETVDAPLYLARISGGHT